MDKEPLKKTKAIIFIQQRCAICLWFFSYYYFFFVGKGLFFLLPCCFCKVMNEASVLHMESKSRRALKEYYLGNTKY